MNTPSAKLGADPVKKKLFRNRYFSKEISTTSFREIIGAPEKLECFYTKVFLSRPLFADSINGFEERWSLTRGLEYGELIY